MAITFIDSDTRDFGGALSITFDMSTLTYAADDFGLVFVKQSENTGQQTWDDDGGGGNGWIRLDYNRSTSGRDQETAIYYKVLSASESDPTFTWNTSGTTEPMSGSILIYRGVDPTTPIQDFSYLFTQNDAAPPSSPVTISETNNAIVMLHANTHDDITTVAAAAGYTLRTSVWNGTSNDHRNHHTADLLAGIGTLGSYTAPDWGHSVANTTPESHAYVVVLQETLPIGITSSPSESTYGSTITLGGFNFEAVQGTGSVELSDTVDFSGTVVTQTIVSWSDTSVDVTLTQGALGNDNVFYLRITNDTGDVSGAKAISLGITPYSAVITNVGTGPEHLWTFDGNYDDTGSSGSSPVVLNPVSGGGSFVSTQISEGTTQSWRCQSSRREAANSSFMNSGTSQNRLFGGWIRLQTVQQGLACVWEEGGGVNNLAFFTGIGNNLVAQLADTGDDNVQAFSDIALTEDRDYHILMRFSYTEAGTKEFRLWLDGIEQSVSGGNPLTSSDLDSHTGDISFGGPGGNLEVAGTDVLFQSVEDCLFSNWHSWQQLIDKADIPILFKRGAVPTVTINSDTEANMQIALDALADTVRPDAPLAIRIEDVAGGGNLNLDADNITFDPRCSMTVEWRGGGTLNWKNLNGSDLSDDGRLFETVGGTINLINPATLTCTGIENDSEIVVYEAGTSTVIGEEEGTTTGTFAVSVEVNSVDIKIYNTGFLPVIIEGVDTSSGDVSIPIQQRLDRFYSNP